MTTERPVTSFCSRQRSAPAAAMAALLAVTAFGGCASAPDPTTDPEGYAEFVETNDPLEPFNRGVFAFNEGVDKVLLTPLAIVYRDILPPKFTEGVDNVLANLQSPVTFFNDLLQGNLDRAGTTLARLAINTTVGIGGLMDPASDFGFPAHGEDFGQTLAVWGLGEGPYLILPLFGPSNPRDAVGLAVDSVVFDPLGYLHAEVFDYNDTVSSLTLTRSFVRGISARAKALEPLDELRESSLDFYATLRSAYRQNRAFEISNGSSGAPGAVGAGYRGTPGR